MRQVASCACAVALTCLAIWPSIGWAQADVAKGHELAVEFCSQCHDIEPDGQMKQNPPSFAAIAAYRTVDQIFDKIFAPHAGMPRLLYTWKWIMEEARVEDVVAYIVSLEKPASAKP
jgi:cytochrome c2